MINWQNTFPSYYFYCQRCTNSRHHSLCGGRLELQKKKKRKVVQWAILNFLNFFLKCLQFYLFPKKPGWKWNSELSIASLINESICDLVCLGVCWVMVYCLTGSLGSPYAILETFSPTILAWAYSLCIRIVMRGPHLIYPLFYYQKQYRSPNNLT